MLIIFGCGRTSPTSPVPNAQDDFATELHSSSPDRQPRHMWGEWRVSIDPRCANADLVPVRAGLAHWDVTAYVSPPGCSGCISFKDISLVDAKHVSMVVRISHPFPESPNLDAFDVRGVVLGTPSAVFNTGGMSHLLQNPDGYTSRWSHEPWADINPFVDFAIEVPERRFAHGTFHERQIIIALPDSGPLEFGYVVDACWLPPSIVEPDVPSLSPHCNEAWGLAATVSGPINGHPGAFAEVTIEFHDWQDNGMKAIVTIEAPDLAASPVPAELISSAQPVKFTCRISNELDAPAGVYPALVRVRDALNDPSTDNLAAFQVIEMAVTDETPPLIGIRIDPVAASLGSQGESAQLVALAEHADGGLCRIDSGVNWLAEGAAINGDELVEVNEGYVTRISSRWWGGVASVTAEYGGHAAHATIYCEDPFADSADVEFGALNEPGGVFTNPQALLGPPSGAGAGGGSLGACSLGYGGTAVCEFVDNIALDGPGPDLIVFENPFYFGSCEWNDATQHAAWNETALVEVSQDGIEWFRFPCNYQPDNTTCGIQPCANPSSFSGLAGIRPVYASVGDNGSLKNGIDPTDPATAGGDSFDLADVGLAWCRFVRLIDTGDINDAPGTERYDDNGDLIMDFGKVSVLGATPGCAGFDGDAIAAVHSASPLSVR